MENGDKSSSDEYVQIPNDEQEVILVSTTKILTKIAGDTPVVNESSSAEPQLLEQFEIIYLTGRSTNTNIQQSSHAIGAVGISRLNVM